VQNELANSNERNARNLGGRTQSTVSDDDETNQFDVNMDNIMKRFKCFNNVISSSNTTDDDEEDETINEPEGEGESSTTDESKPATEERQIEVFLPQQEALDSKFADSGFWKVDPLEDDLDALLADYKWACFDWGCWWLYHAQLHSPN
jgi:hypothetical protein